MKGSDEDIENRNLVDLINRDLHEDESTSEEVIFGNKNVHLIDEDESNANLEGANTTIENTVNQVDIRHEAQNKNDNESSDNDITDISEHADSSEKDIDERDESDSSISADITDVSEKLDEDDGECKVEDGEEAIHQVPNINITKNSTTDDSSSSSHTRGARREKRRKLSEQLNNVKSRLEEESRNSEVLRIELNDEKDTKHRLESSLSELQWKFDRQLKDEEELRHQLHKKDELNTILERKELELIQELVQVKRKLSENLDNQCMASNMQDDSYTQEHQSVNEKLIIDVNELQCKLETSEQLLADKDKHIESLSNELTILKEQLSKYEEDESKEQPEMERLEAVSLNYDKIQDQIKAMVETVIDDSHKRLRIKDLEEEVMKLKHQLEENKDKYSANLSEALSTLKQVQDAYGEMRDVVLEGYKQEITLLQERVRIAEEKSNEDIITGLRQELLDARLQQERSKQAHKDEIEMQQKRFDECESRGNDLLNEAGKIKLELEKRNELDKIMQNSLQKLQMIVDERTQKIEDLNHQLNSQLVSINIMKENISEKDGLVSELKNQLLKEAEILTKEHAEKESLQLEVELIESIKRQNQRLEEEIEEMSHKVKLRGTKIKFLKKHIKELEEQKKKAECLMLVIPEMQKKIDELTEEKEKLRQDILDKEREEEEAKRKLEEEKREEEERAHKEKEEWERRILGIGKCLEYHEEEKETDANGVVISRPNSAPSLKPRPPTAKRQPTKNHSKPSLFRAPTLNPAFLNSYPEGRKATQKMKQHQEKIILTAQNRDNLFRSVTKPMSYSNATFKHMSDGKYFPKISPRAKDNSSAPRVLVWGNGDGPGSKMVAVGDLVLINIRSDCSAHGQCSKQHHGIVKFIGFVDGNNDDVYIGLRLEEEVGYTDGIIQGKRYFRSEPEKGAFVHLDDIVEILQTQTKHVPSLTM